MSVPRPVILAVLGVALAAAALVFVRGSANNSTVTPAPVPVHVTQTHRAPAPVVHRQVKPVTPHRSASTPKPAPAPAKPQTGLAGVVSALNSGNTVVLAVTQAGPADDEATHDAVETLKGMKRVSIFYVGLGDLTAYRALLSNTGISQVPAVVVMRTGSKARLIEGYVDPASLRQTVADIQG